MRLSAKKVPYSQTVGGGLMLCGPDGMELYIVSFIGTLGISKEETQALTEQFEQFVNNHDVVMPLSAIPPNRR